VELVVVVVLAVVLAAVAPFALGASPPSLGASLGIPAHLRVHICLSISHLLHNPHLGSNCWISPD
jgi:hypothetical protein